MLQELAKFPANESIRNSRYVSVESIWVDNLHAIHLVWTNNEFILLPLGSFAIRKK